MYAYKYFIHVYLYNNICIYGRVVEEHRVLVPLSEKTLSARENLYTLSFTPQPLPPTLYIPRLGAGARVQVSNAGRRKRRVLD